VRLSGCDGTAVKSDGIGFGPLLVEGVSHPVELNRGNSELYATQD